jgi:hypothetical protein
MIDGALVGRILRPPHTHTGEKDTHRAQDKADPNDNEQLSKQRVFDLSEYPKKQVAPTVKHHQGNKNVDGKMRPCIEPSNGPASLSPFRVWLDCIINTSGYDFRKGQVSLTCFSQRQCPLSSRKRTFGGNKNRWEIAPLGCFALRLTYNPQNATRFIRPMLARNESGGRRQYRAADDQHALHRHDGH